MDCCPICNIDLGCVPLEKLRADHNLQDVRAKLFPHKRINVKAPELVTPVVLPAKRKERSLSSLVVSTPRVSTQIGMTGRRSKSIARKASKGSSFIIEKPVSNSTEDQPESSSSPELLNKFTQSLRQNSAAGEPSNQPNSDRGRGNAPDYWEGKVDLWKPLTCLVEAANRSKSSKFSTQGTLAKSEEQLSYENEGLPRKTKNKEQRKKSKVKDEKNYGDHAPPESERPKRFSRIREKARNFGELAPPQAVLDAASAKLDRRTNPIWFSLVASNEVEGDAPPLPQLSASYLRINMGTLEGVVLISLHSSQGWKYTCFFIQKYLKRKLDLTTEAEVDIKCMGQTVIPTLTLNNLVDLWLQTTSTERVSATIGSSAKEFVMFLTVSGLEAPVSVLFSDSTLWLLPWTLLYGYDHGIVVEEVVQVGGTWGKEFGFQISLCLYLRRCLCFDTIRKALDPRTKLEQSNLRPPISPQTTVLRFIYTDELRRTQYSLQTHLRIGFTRMVYIASWDDFVEKSVQLFRADPEKTRYVMKYRHCDGKLVLKVTDDKECIKFKTDQAQDAKKMEKLNNVFFTLMARGPEVRTENRP
ncbi:UNVERIFIED_CONTAM: E3 ubiquitin protein ligase DRIP2 [Sesamum calycinum]|uniref:Signal recognition particle 9 kDa protein n=1 Tax=Sesamum calycinum TaxID=2727403 RepID=A0AAW2SGX5_9LAMI